MVEKQNVKKKKKQVVKSEFYKQLESQKKIAEQQLIISLYSHIDSFYDYKVKVENITDTAWKFYYILLRDLIKINKISKIDELTVNAFVSTRKEAYQKLYERYGGYKTIERAIATVESENIDGQYLQMQKYATLLRFCEMGFPVERNWDKIQKMDLEEINAYFEGLVANAFIQTDFMQDKVEDLFEDVNRLIEDADEGIDVGLPLDSPLLNDVQNGLPLGHITLLGAHSGVGKTFLTIMMHITSCIKHNEPLLIIANEEERPRYVFNLLTAYINLKHPNANFNKRVFHRGGFTDEEKELLAEAAEYYKTNVQDNIVKFVNMQEFNMGKTIKIIKKYANLYDIKYFILDTLKLDNDTQSRANDQSWLQLQQNMVKLYNVIKPSNLNVHVWVTTQLRKDNRNSKYLDQSSLGIAKNIADVVSSLILVRMVSEGEKGGKGLVVKRGKQQVILKEDNDYMLFFWDKNRQGSTNKQAILRVDKGRNMVKDIGYTKIDQQLM